MTADETAAGWLRAFINKAGHVPAVGGFVAEDRHVSVAGDAVALRGAVNHARAALAAYERGDMDAFRALHTTTRDFLLDAERRQTDVEAARAVEAERAIRLRGPRQPRPGARTQAAIDAVAFDLATTLRPAAVELSGRINIVRLARLVAEAAQEQGITLGEVATIDARIRREAQRRGVDFARWID